LVNDPSGCAADLAGAVHAITAASANIVQGVAACPPKTDDKDKLCAGAITLAITHFSLASEELASASRTCANTMGTVKGSECAEEISDTVKQFGVTSAFLIESTETCEPPSEGGSAFGCVVSVVDVVDALANAAEGINNAVVKCGEAKERDPKMMYLYQTWLATGCPRLPSPDWINWGYWYADSQNSSKTVLRSMYEWCLGAKTGGDLHEAQMCCGRGVSSCPGAQCGLQTHFTGTYVAPKTPPGDEVRSHTQLENSWPLTLE
jgi:hypothetical protein